MSVFTSRRFWVLVATTGLLVVASFFPNELGELNIEVLAEAFADLAVPLALIVVGWFTSMGLRTHE